MNALLGKGITRRPEKHQIQRIRKECVERKRLVLAFLADKLADENSILSEEKLTTILNGWKELRMWEKYNYAQIALSEENYQKYVVEGDDLHEFTNNELKEFSEKYTKKLNSRKEGN